MCVAEGTKFVIVPIKDYWYDFYLEPDGKYVTLFGKDSTNPQTSPFDGGVYFDDMVLISVAFEHHRSDNMLVEILDEAWDDEGNKYLIIERTPYDKK